MSHFTLSHKKTVHTARKIMTSKNLRTKRRFLCDNQKSADNFGCPHYVYRFTTIQATAYILLLIAAMTISAHPSMP